MNIHTVSLAIRFAMSRIVGESGWPVAGTLGNALSLELLGKPTEARKAYAYARRYLCHAIRTGKFLPKVNR